MVDKPAQFEKRKILFQSFLALITRTFAAGISFLLTVVVTNSLSQVDSGLFFISLTMFNVLSVVFTLGFDTVLLKKMSFVENDEAVKQDVFASLFLSFVVSGLVALALTATSGWMSLVVFNKPELNNALFFMIICFPFQAGLQIISNMLQALQKTVLAISVVKLIIPTMVVLVVFLAGVSDLRLLVGLYLLVTAITFTFSVFLIRNYLIVSSGSLRRFANLFREARNFWMITVFQQISIWAGQLVVGVYLPAEDAAIYAVCRNTTMMMSFLLVAVNFVSAPRFAKFFEEGRHESLREHFIFTNKILLTVSVPVMIVMVFGADFILSLFGSGYSSEVSKQTLIILSIGQFVNVVSGSVGYMLLMTGNERYYRNGVVINGILAIGLSFLLVPNYGVIGSALATVISMIFVNGYNAYFVNLKLGIPALVFRK
ncbi:MAG: oligosaccharide flippase family protein [Flavobacteriales bacterium]|nr:oligosaccharide flippase family protein [Flavobacteriales bacterium]